MLSSPNSYVRVARISLMVAFGLGAILMLLQIARPLGSSDLKPPVSAHGRRALVVPALQSENTSWITSNLAGWDHNIYVVDDPNAALTVPINKGREVMVYLTYIIDNYEKLPDYMVFIHSARYQWHNDHPTYDGLPLLQHLNLQLLDTRGYINLRCTHLLGCPVAMMIPPAELTPSVTILEDIHTLRELPSERFYAKAFHELFPAKPIPTSVGASCCAQFALSRQKALEHPLEEWKRWRQWVTDSELPDRVLGRVWEYSWHILFGMPDRHCPDAETCYCELWGLCNVVCDGKMCGRYRLPKTGRIPNGWPEVGWDGEEGPGERGL